MEKPTADSTADQDEGEDAFAITRLRSGDRQVFDNLYTRYAPRVMGFLLRLTGDRTEAEDLTQETFVAGYSSSASYQGRSRPLAWLLGIAARRWRDSRRRYRPTEETLEETIAEKNTGTEQSALAKVALEVALDRLEPNFREALLLVASQGLTYQEAAETLGEPVGTVKWRVYEATRRMRTLLEDAEEESLLPASHPQEEASSGMERGKRDTQRRWADDRA